VIPHNPHLTPSADAHSAVSLTSIEAGSTTLEETVIGLRHVVFVVSAAATARAQAPGARGASRDTLPLQHAVRGNVVPVNQGRIGGIEIDRLFRYVGGHRFILLGVADAEQHAFAVADSAGNIQRFYWIQLEQYLPSAATAAYDYSQDSLVMRNGLEWRAQARRYNEAPNPGSDREALYALFSKAGLRAPLAAARVRLVHLTSDDRRSELMIIYAEAAATASDLTRDEAARLIARAQKGLRTMQR
jgi:hypothetical protein